MRYLKKILFYLMVILTFTLSFSKEENRITVYERNNEPAKLKIGVTKLKTKELPMDFDVEKKIVYCELPEEIGESDLLYVSETLDEIPSVSTTNGRRTINNIKKYLTKDVKANSKFNYRIEAIKKDESEKEKKYLVINCREQVTNVYIYVVERDTYKMKKLYRGKFNLIDTLDADTSGETINYGIIKFFNTNDLRDGDIITSTSGNNIVVHRGRDIEQEIGKVVAPLGKDGFPKKYIYNEGSIKYRVKVTTGTGVVVRQEIDDNLLWGKFDGKFDIKLPVNTVDSNMRALRENIRIFTDDRDYIKIQLQNWDNNYSSLKLPITIDFYRTGNILDEEDSEFDHLKTISFILVIDPKEKAEADNKKSSIHIEPTEELHSKNGNGGAVISYDGNQAMMSRNGINIPSSSEYINLSEGYLERFETLESKRLQIIQNDKIIKEDILVNPLGEFKHDIEIFGEKTNTKIGTVKIYGEENSKYLKYGINITAPYRDRIEDEFQLRYYDEGNNLLKVDTLNLRIDNVQEEELEENSGGLYVKFAGGINSAELTPISLDAGSLKLIRDGDETIFDTNNARILGNFPMRLGNVGDDKHDWGSRQKIVIINESDNTRNIEKYLGVGGTFSTAFDDENDTPVLSTDRDHSSAGGAIKDKDCNIGIRATANNPYLEIAIYDYNANAETILDKTLRLEYQIEIEGKWITKKVDRLKIIIQPGNIIGNEPKINIHNPVVWYEYSKSTPIRNYRKAELYQDEATTLQENGVSKFTKNTDLNGREWIEASDIPEYIWWERHKIEINTGRGNVIKYTDENGKTKSSTFINTSGSNWVMVAYDGKDPGDTSGQKDKSLSFGVAEYNFEKSSGSFIISQYDRVGNLEKVQQYNVEMDRFSGIHYVDKGFDIQPRKDYTKTHIFEQELGVIKPIEIDYGEVGFRDLDTRITEQSGGDGIELRLTENVTLIGEGEFAGYEIPAKMEFEVKDRVFEETYNSEIYHIFKGENEKQTSVDIKLTIPNQEYLIPQTRFKIVETKDKNRSPLKVGVVVKGDKEEYFEEVADLYLNLSEQRFVKTELIFENPSIQEEASDIDNKMKWIKLNNGSYSKGYIENYTGKNWGQVREEVVDVPNNLNGELIIKVIDEEYKNTLIENLTDRVCDIKIGETEPNTLQIAYDKGSDYLKFRVNNDKVPYNSGKSGKFYLRFELVQNKDTPNEKVEYLFTQQYIVKFNDQPGFTGNTEIVIKNPMMAMENDKYGIYIDKKKNIQGSVKENGNHNTQQDSEKWWNVEFPVNYPSLDKHNYTLYEDANLQNQLTDFSKINLKFVDDSGNNQYSTLLIGVGDSGYDGSELIKEIYVKWVEKNPGQTPWERKDQIVVVREKFDPTYYGKLFPSNEVDDIGANNHIDEYDVGEGYEEIKNTTEGKDFFYIDLNTTFREYQRYMGILEDIGTENFVIREKLNQKVIARDESNREILGKIVFKEESNPDVNYLEEVSLKLNKNSTTSLPTPDRYKLYFKVTADEYKKLKYNTKYNLFIGEEKNVLEMGYKDRAGDLACKTLTLKNNLNFTTSREPFEIIPFHLDFGEINVLNNNGTPIRKYAKTLVLLRGEEIENVELTLEGVNQSEDGKYITYVKRYDENGTVPNAPQLKVEKVTLERGYTSEEARKSNETKEKKTKDYTLDGEIVVPLDSELGTYRGLLYINTTIIAN